MVRNALVRSALVFGVLTTGCVARAASEAAARGPVPETGDAGAPADSATVTHRAPTGTRAHTPGRDTTLIGVIAITGTEPAWDAVLRTPGARDVVLRGDQRTTLGRLAGLELAVRGTYHAAGDGAPWPVLVAQDFQVLRWERHPVLDGRLALTPRGLSLVTGDGQTIPIAHPPAAFADWAGARIWIARTSTGALEAYGLIALPD